MQTKKPTNGRERLIERLTESLENFRTIYEQKLRTTYHPGDLFPSSYLANLEHYMRVFLWIPIIDPDTLVRLNAATVFTDYIEVTDAPQIVEFSESIDELTSIIRGKYRWQNNRPIHSK